MATLNIKRFPDELYHMLGKCAVNDHRSLAQEVIYLLKLALKQTQKTSILELQGLGKEKWADIDVHMHIKKERDAWE